LRSNKGRFIDTTQFAGGDRNTKCIDAAKAELALTITTEAPINEQCAVNIERLKQLERGVTKESDEYFPADLTSVGDGGERWNNWIHFNDL